MDVSRLFSASDGEVVDLSQNYDFNEDFSTPTVVNTEELRDRYGNLCVVKEVAQINNRRRFLFKCDCGKEKEIDLNSVRTGNTLSCGWRRIVTGKQIGRAHV